jgi:hypothetical protein
MRMAVPYVDQIENRPIVWISAKQDDQKSLKDDARGESPPNPTAMFDVSDCTARCDARRIAAFL